jgi:hypothetical protein
MEGWSRSGYQMSTCRVLTNSIGHYNDQTCADCRKISISLIDPRAIVGYEVVARRHLVLLQGLSSTASAVASVVPMFSAACVVASRQ